MAVKTVRQFFSVDAETLALARLSLAIAEQAQCKLEKIEGKARSEEAFRLSAHCNNRSGDSIPSSRRGEARILGGPLSLAQRHSAGRISVRGGN